MYTAMHDFLYTPIEYKEIKSEFLNCTKQLGDSLFQFLYVDKMKAYFDTYYSHQGIKVTYNSNISSFTLIYIVVFFLIVIVFYIYKYNSLLVHFVLKDVFHRHCWNRHFNQDTTFNIEAYHGTVKHWMLIDNRDKHGRRIDFLVCQFTTLVMFHYMYM